MQTLRSHIDAQIARNRGKNLFHPSRGDLFTFLEGTADWKEELTTCSRNEADDLVAYVTDRSLEAFFQVNPYLQVGSSSKEELKEVYARLLEHFRRPDPGTSPGLLARRHYRELQEWLRKTDPSSERIFGPLPAFPPVPVCAEYRPDLQMALLGGDPSDWLEPVLDLGCGPSGALVIRLRELGLEAVGLDRCRAAAPHCLTGNWLEFDYGTSTWGTIVSHQGFSNHFRHHHQRTDGDYLRYARTFMAILHSLRPGGSFLYTPGLEFMEGLLPPDKYRVECRPVPGTDHSVTRIRVQEP
ncbi:MAG: class I SAM-dependent methyltransferase [Bacteroidales bacterium]